MSDFYTSVVKYGNDILYRGYRDGIRVNQRIKYRPYMFTEGSRHSTSAYKTIYGNPANKIEFASLNDAKSYLKEDVKGRVVHGYDKFQNQFIYENFPGKIEYDIDLIRVADIDIEVAADDGFPDIDEADREVTAITMMIGGKLYAFGCGPFMPPPEVTYFRCDDESHLLQSFIDIWAIDHPDIVTGWNTDFFDIPYLVNRIKKLLGERAAEKLSPWGILFEKEIEFRGRKHMVFTPVGVNCLDFLRLYRNKKLVMEPQPEYTLNHISSVTLGEKKLDYSEYESLLELYKRDFQKFMEYNIRDVLLVEKLEAKMKLIKLVCIMGYMAKVNYEEVMGSVSQWEAIIHAELMDRGVVMPPRKIQVKQELIGAYCKEPKTGLYHHVVSLDLDSLYSHLIMQFNISPETFIGCLKPDDSVQSRIDGALNGSFNDLHADLVAENSALTGNLCVYSKEKKGFLPEILERMYAARVEYKDKMIDAKRRLELIPESDKAVRLSVENEIAEYNNAQMALKTNLNSVYGCLTNEWFRFYSHFNAEAITSSGQLAIRWIEKSVNRYMNEIVKSQGFDYIIASDTDSIYINMGPLVDRVFAGKKPAPGKIADFIDRVVKDKVQPFIEASFTELAEYTNSMAQKMRMKRESIADKGIWTGKKRYILNILDKEGVRFAKPKIEVKGMESVRSSTPQVCRKEIKTIIETIITGTEDDVIEQIAGFREKFMKLPFEDVASPRGVNGLRKYADPHGLCKLKTPIQVRGALVYNKVIKERGLKQFLPIYDGDKVKFCYLTLPNPVHSYVISVSGPLPPQLDLDRYIDREEQFDKAFVEPLRKILDVIGWTTERVNTLDAFCA